MINRTTDGTILNSNTSKVSAPNYESKYRNFTLHIACITKQEYRKNRVVYSAVLVSGPRQGEMIHNLVPMDSFGGYENYNEIIYQPKTKATTGKGNGDSTPPEATDGSYVIVGFVNGNYNHPVILGGWHHPTNEDNTSKVADGTRIKGRFNNVEWLIDSGGNFKINNKNATIYINTDGNISVTTNKNVTINTDQKTIINTQGNTEINSQGKTKVTAQGNVEVSSAQKVNVSGDTGISFTGPYVHIGSDGAAQHLVRGDIFKSYLDAHVHPDPDGGFTGPPTVAMPSNTLSSKATVD